MMYLDNKCLKTWYFSPPGTRRCCDVERQLMTLIQHRNKYVWWEVFITIFTNFVTESFWILHLPSSNLFFVTYRGLHQKNKDDFISSTYTGIHIISPLSSFNQSEWISLISLWILNQFSKKLRKLFPSHAAITLKNGVGTVYNLYIPDPAQTGILSIIIWSRISYTKNNIN